MASTSRSAADRIVTALQRERVHGSSEAGVVGRRRPDRVAVEEPMEIRVGPPHGETTTITVTMRTPGHDFELAVGFLLSEGILASANDVRAVMYCERPEGEEQRYNIVTVRATAFEPTAPRRNITTSSCGICGTASLEDLDRTISPTVPADGPVFAADVLLGFPARLLELQRVFATTGGLHAAALATIEGNVHTVREDVGRHNAVDKVIGHESLERSDAMRASALVVSGRASFEIVQKAAMARIPLLVAVSAPSSLAVEAAERAGMTLVGFTRQDTANIYTHPQRVAFTGP
jgi:FdhD protein